RHHAGDDDLRAGRRRRLAGEERRPQVPGGAGAVHPQRAEGPAAAAGGGALTPGPLTTECPMRASPRARCLVAAAAAVAVLAGCNKRTDVGGPAGPAGGPDPASPAVNDLKRLGLLYQGYCSANMRAPSGVEDFAPWVKMEPSLGPVVDGVRS